MSAEMVFWFDWWLATIAARSPHCQRWASVRELLRADADEEQVLRATYGVRP